MCEPCTKICEVKTICDACVPDGEWKHSRGIIPCHPVPKKWFGALDNSDWANGKIVDAEVQRDRFRLRDDK
jgi:hypothetical protein